MRRFLSLILLMFMTLTTLVVVGAYLAFQYYNYDLPDYHQLASYEPPVVTRLYASDGKLFGEYATEKRAFMPINSMPKRIIKTFLAAEDKNFYSHNGIDIFGILRAAVTNLARVGAGKRLVGASTITQQVAKNFLLSNEVSFARKIKEAILAYRIEQALSKDRILELYLNEIYLGRGCYGVAAAALNYFNKSLEELTIEEAAYLAALPKAPSMYDPRKSPERAKGRRDYIINRMVEEGVISAQDGEEAKKIELNLIDSRVAQTVVGGEFFSEEVRRHLLSTFGADALYKGGLVVKTSLDPKLQALADESLRLGLIEYDERHGWKKPIARLTLQEKQDWLKPLQDIVRPAGLGTWELAVVLNLTPKAAEIGLKDGKVSLIPLEHLKWARKWLSDNSIGKEITKPSDVLQVGDVIAVEYLPQEKVYRLRQIPEVSGAVVAMDPHTGRVLAMSGGYSYEMSEFNRATQAIRQPGSAFKPFVYLSAFEKGYTPATIINDTFFSIDMGHGLGVYEPKNIDSKFLGPITLRMAMEKSRNLVSIRIAHELVGMSRIADVAARFGVTENMPKQLAMALGAGETTVIKLTTAYAMMANGGKKITPSLIDQVQDRQGKIVFRNDMRPCEQCKDQFWKNQNFPELPDTRVQVSDPASVYQIVSLLEGVVERGTARRAKVIGKPLAGKTGTTNDSKDTWFVGFTPDLVVGVFVGFDNPRDMGKKEVGGRVALPIFIRFMSTALKNTPAIPFRIPAGLKMVRVNAATGQPVSASHPQAILEAFKPGTEPGAINPSPGPEPERVAEERETAKFPFSEDSLTSPLSRESSHLSNGVPAVTNPTPKPIDVVPSPKAESVPENGMGDVY